jgi:hypothetical protein
MKTERSVAMAIGVLVASFAGGASAQWAVHSVDAAYAAARAGKTTTLRAQAFDLVDAKGKLFARLSVTPNGPVLVLKDKTGADVVGLGFWEEGAGLGLKPKLGKAAVSLGVSTDGRYAGLGIQDENGQRTVMLGTSKY